MSKIRIIAILLSIAFFSACVKDGEDLCPPEPKDLTGNAIIHVYAEKFRNKSQNPLDDRVDNFGEVISHLRYFIYKNGELFDEGIIDKFPKADLDRHTFTISDLEYGEYKMVLVANSIRERLTGVAAKSANLLLTFPGCLDNEDYFTAVFPFSIKDDRNTEYDVGLLRTNGVIRYTFNNMPAEVSDIEVVMKNVYLEKWIDGEYKNVCDANMKYTIIPLKRQTVTDDYIIGTFPTPANEYSAFHINLYQKGETEPYMSRMVAEDLSVIRNQLLDITVTFNNGELDFIIDLDSDWDGTSSGGSVVIE